MRIRKRQVPFPITSLSPVPLSDLHLPVVQLHQNLFQEDDTAAYYNRPSSDHSNQPIGDEKIVINNKLQVKDCPVKEEHGEKSNDTRKESLLGAHIETQVDSSEEKCVDGDETFSMKKRNGNLETTMDKVGNKMKNKMNKKSNNNDEDEEEDYKESKDGAGSSNANARKKAKGGALMEGSRCSRVNGRGWRCCQQTLVGYSLCEHHLGKGRLRSMNSVRNRSKKSAVITTTNHNKALSNCSLSTSDDKDQEMKMSSADDKIFDMGDRDCDVRGEKKPLVMSKRKMKLGVVKARSISTLLGQASNGNADEENNK